jgi:hypothetical protein
MQAKQTQSRTKRSSAGWDAERNRAERRESIGKGNEEESRSETTQSRAKQDGAEQQQVAWAPRARKKKSWNTVEHVGRLTVG